MPISNPTHLSKIERRETAGAGVGVNLSIFFIQQRSVKNLIKLSSVVRSGPTLAVNMDSKIQR
jgi:hypothetical protein